jgi:Cu/Ag efflux pump CusA
MTSFAFIFGTLPLALASGAGAGARQSIGTTVAAGMLLATLLGILVIPTFYVLMQRVSERQWPFERARKKPSQAVAQPPGIDA